MSVWVLEESEKKIALWQKSWYSYMHEKVFFSCLPVASAFLVTLSFPSVDFGILAWFGLSPLFFALRQRGVILSTWRSFSIWLSSRVRSFLLGYCCSLNHAI